MPVVIQFVIEPMTVKSVKVDALRLLTSPIISKLLEEGEVSGNASVVGLPTEYPVTVVLPVVSVDAEVIFHS